MVIFACHSSKGHLCGPSASRTQPHTLQMSPLSQWGCACARVSVCACWITFPVFCSIRSHFLLFFPPSSIFYLFIFFVFLSVLKIHARLPLSVSTRQAVNIYMYWNYADRSLAISVSYWQGSVTFPALPLCNWLFFFFQAVVHYLYYQCLREP